MRSIELTFDGSTEHLIRRDWAVLAQSGIPSLAAHTAPSNRPHITLAAGSTLAAAPETPELWAVLPVPVRLSGLVLFPAGPGRYVLARLVVTSAALLDVHASLHRNCTGAAGNTLPGAWTPHVTLARRVPGHLLGAAADTLDVLQEGWCTGARLWDGATKTVTGLTPVR